MCRWGGFRPNKEGETVSQQPPNPVQGGLSQFLSWIENNSHRLRLHQGKMENPAWILQTELNWMGDLLEPKPSSWSGKVR